MLSPPVNRCGKGRLQIQFSWIGRSKLVDLTMQHDALAVTLHLSPQSKSTEYVKRTGICSILMFGINPFKYLTLLDGVVLINDLFIHERD